MTGRQDRPGKAEFVEAPWMRVALAELELGVQEAPGNRDNPRILEYFTATSYAAGHDGVPWCSAFVNWCLQTSGYPGTGSAAARSWLAWGRGVERAAPGCVVVLWRESPDASQGHVGFYYGHSPGRQGHINLLGGNQGNRVSIKPYPRERVLGYRLPA